MSDAEWFLVGYLGAQMALVIYVFFHSKMIAR
jgi:hypothetical protein